MMINVCKQSARDKFKSALILELVELDDQRASAEKN